MYSRLHSHHIRFSLKAHHWCYVKTTTHYSGVLEHLKRRRLETLLPPGLVGKLQVCVLVWMGRNWDIWKWRRSQPALASWLVLIIQLRKSSAIIIITHLSFETAPHSLHLNSHWKVNLKRGSAQESIASRSGMANTGVSLLPEKKRIENIHLLEHNPWNCRGLTDAAVALYRKL